MAEVSCQDEREYYATPGLLRAHATPWELCLLKYRLPERNRLHNDSLFLGSSRSEQHK